MAKRKKQQGQVNPRNASLVDPLRAVPLVPENVEIKRDDQGYIHLRLTAPLRGFRRRLANWLGYRAQAEHLLELDELGTQYYERVNGQRTLRDIAGEMAGHHRCPPEEMNERVKEFTRHLMQRQMVLLKMEYK